LRPIPYVQPDAASWLAKFRFAIPIKPRYFETDMFGHVNNISYFIYFEQGRSDYFENLGLTEELFNEGNAIVVADLECQYLAQVFKKDRLRLRVRAAKLGRSSIQLEYALVGEVTDQLKATGRGTMVYIDKRQGGSAPLPDAIKQAIRAFEEMEE